MLSVGPVGPVVYTIRTITILGWLTAILATTPYGHAIPDSVSRLAIGVAIVGSFKYIIRRSQKPAHEFYLAGKEMGRAELLREQASGDGVINLDDRRRALPRRGLRQAMGGALADQ